MSGTGPPTPPPPDARLLTRFGSRISRDSAIYALGMGMVFPFSLIQVAVLTRFLDPASFGTLGILFVYAGLLTILYNIGTLQGTFIWTFGASEGGEDDGDVSAGDDAGDVDRLADDKRRALGSGLLLLCAIVGVGTFAIVAFSEQLAVLLVGDEEHADAVMWAAASAAMGSIWRLTSNVFRLERRPVLFGVMQVARPLFVLGAVVPLVASGHGVAGALLGTTVGTAAAVLVSLFIGRRSYAVALQREDVRQILKRGARFIPIVVGLWVLHNADLLLLAPYESDEEVGIYRLASRLASVPSYFVSAFLMALIPLERTALFQATYERRGWAVTRSTMFTYYWIGALTLVLLLGLAAHGLVRIAPPSYAEAADLVPLIAFALAVYGAFIVLIRSAKFPGRNLAYGALALICAALFAGLSVILIPWLGAYGAPAAVIGALVVGCAAIVTLMHVRGSDPIPLQYVRLTVTLLLAAACLLGGRELAAQTGDWRPAVDTVAFVVFAVLLVALGIVPREHTRPLLRVLRASLPERSRPRELMRRLDGVPPRRRSVLEAIAREGRSAEEVARAELISEREVGIRLTRALRQVTGVGAGNGSDAELGRYLLDTGPPAARDALAKSLWTEGVDPLEMHELEGALEELRRTRERVWLKAERRGA